MSIKPAKFPIEERGDASLIRPKFNPGQFLQDDDLTRAVDYSRELVRLLFRTMLGCGVLCGFEVTASVDCGRMRIGVARGVALTCDGEVIEMPEDRTIEIDPTCGPAVPTEIWVVICTGEKSCAPRETHCSDDEDEASMAATRIREGYTLKLLTERPPGACGCQERAQGNPALPPPPQTDCYEDHVLGRCCCECGCPCVVLARVRHQLDGNQLTIAIFHGVRRFIRPQLLHDPLLPAAAPPPPPHGTGTTTTTTATGTGHANMPNDAVNQTATAPGNAKA